MLRRILIALAFAVVVAVSAATLAVVPLSHSIPFTIQSGFVPRSSCLSFSSSYNANLRSGVRVSLSWSTSDRTLADVDLWNGPDADNLSNDTEVYSAVGSSGGTTFTSNDEGYFVAVTGSCTTFVNGSFTEAYPLL
jgi:hypothetical protein